MGEHNIKIGMAFKKKELLAFLLLFFFLMMLILFKPITGEVFVYGMFMGAALSCLVWLAIMAILTIWGD